MALRREPLIWALVALVAVLIFIVYKVERPEHITAVTVFVIFESTVTLITLATLLFANFAWHLRLFKGWFVRVPDARGTWIGYISPLNAPDEYGEPIDAELIVRQKPVRDPMHSFNGSWLAKRQLRRKRLYRRRHGRRARGVCVSCDASSGRARDQSWGQRHGYAGLQRKRRARGDVLQRSLHTGNDAPYEDIETYSPLDC